jgi:hypothetical protein
MDLLDIWAAYSRSPALGSGTNEQPDLDDSRNSGKLAGALSWQPRFAGAFA